MELTPYLFWNIFITLVLAPVLYGIRGNTAEAKRIDILLNKTREEIARDYVTKQELKDDMNVLMDRLEKLHEKIFSNIHAQRQIAQSNWCKKIVDKNGCWKRHQN